MSVTQGVIALKCETNTCCTQGFALNAHPREKVKTEVLSGWKLSLYLCYQNLKLDLILLVAFGIQKVSVHLSFCKLSMVILV